MFTRFEENTNSNNTNSFTDYQSAPTTTPNPSPDNNYTTRSCLEIINDGNNDSDTNSVDLASLADENDQANSPPLNHFASDKCSAKLYYNAHHHAHHFNHHQLLAHNDLMNSYCLENISSPMSSPTDPKLFKISGVSMSSGIDGSNFNNIDNNNMSTCLSSSPLSSYSPEDQMKHDNNSYHRHIQQHDNDLSSQKSGKSSDRNVHCVKEKIRRDRIKYSCNELRRLIPNLNGLKTDMASLLETSVLWIQLINSNIPQEFLDDVQIKLEKMTTAQNNYSSFSPQRSSSSSNVSISMPIASPCSSTLLNQTNFKTNKRSRKAMSNLNKQMLNEEKMRLIKAQQQPPSLIPSKMAMPTYSSSPLINNNVLVTTYHETNDYATSLESCSKQSKMMLINHNNNNNNQKLYSSTSEFPFKCQYLNPELIHHQQHNTNSFDYSSNYDLYNKLIKKGCQFIDNNINLSANAMHLKLNSKQMATDFDLPYSSQIQNFVQNN